MKHFATIGPLMPLSNDYFLFKNRKGSFFWEKFLWEQTRLGHFGLQQQVDVYECFLPVWIFEGNHYVCTQLSPKACLLAKWLHYLHTFNQQPALHQVIKKGWTMDYPTQQQSNQRKMGSCNRENFSSHTNTYLFPIISYKVFYSRMRSFKSFREFKERW